MGVLAGQTFSAPLYRQEMLADAPEPLELPADRPRPAQPDPAGAFVRVELDEAETAGLRALGMRHRATLSTTLLAGWAAVLGRLSGQTDLVIGTFTESAVNPLPVRVELSGRPTAFEGPTVAEMAGRVDAAQEAMDEQLARVDPDEMAQLLALLVESTVA